MVIYSFISDSVDLVVKLFLIHCLFRVTVYIIDQFEVLRILFNFEIFGQGICMDMDEFEPFQN